MKTEFDILIDIYSDLCRHIEYVKITKNKLKEINDNINKLDSNYVDLKCDGPLFVEYFDMYRNNDMYKKVINNFETLKAEITNNIKNICEHEWIEDDIDISPDRSQRICYCVKCEATKK
jgi:hypothetical protein